MNGCPLIPLRQSKVRSRETRMDAPESAYDLMLTEFRTSAEALRLR